MNFADAAVSAALAGAGAQELMKRRSTWMAA
jgi:hypothetical protein